MDKKVHKCTFNGCTTAFSRPFRLTQHLLTHVNVRAFRCTKCSKTYTTKSHLIRHDNTVHLKIKTDVIYSCPECMQVFANRQNLKRHMLKKHIQGINNYCCEHCKKYFRKINQLRSHMYQHTGIKSFKCNKCFKEFITHYEKRKHMRCHKIYICEECKKQFDKYNDFQKHKKEHDTKEYCCDKCGVSFKERILIVRHLKKHSQSNNRHFPCPHQNCGRTYSRNSNLKQHILTKHEQITHDCHICNTRLCSKAKLNNHLKLHNKPITEVVSVRANTKAAGRKTRKDMGVPRKSIALKLAGFEEQNEIKSAIPYLAETCMT